MEVKTVLQYFYLTYMLHKKVSTIQQAELCLFSPGFMRICRRSSGGKRRKEEKQSIELTGWTLNSTTRYDTNTHSSFTQYLTGAVFQHVWQMNICINQMNILCLSENHWSSPGQENSVALIKHTGYTFYCRVNQQHENIFTIFKNKTT